jgi:hypothetical protein
MPHSHWIVNRFYGLTAGNLYIIYIDRDNGARKGWPTMRALPTDWPERVRQAARQGRHDWSVVLELLIKHDPDGLRQQDFDATARAAFYTRRIEDLARAA